MSRLWFLLQWLIHISLYFSCLLLKIAGPKSFNDLKIFGDTRCATFTEAAQKHGLLESDEMHYRAMNDAEVEMSSFRQLQRYFAMLLYHARPNNPQQFFDHFVDKMNPPVALNNPMINPKSEAIRRAEILRNLEYYFNCMGSSCKYRFTLRNYQHILFTLLSIRIIIQL